MNKINLLTLLTGIILLFVSPFVGAIKLTFKLYNTAPKNFAECKIEIGAGSDKRFKTLWAKPGAGNPPVTGYVDFPNNNPPSSTPITVWCRYVGSTPVKGRIGFNGVQMVNNIEGGGPLGPQGKWVIIPCNTWSTCRLGEEMGAPGTRTSETLLIEMLLSR